MDRLPTSPPAPFRRQRPPCPPPPPPFRCCCPSSSRWWWSGSGLRPVRARRRLETRDLSNNEQRQHRSRGASYVARRARVDPCPLLSAPSQPSLSPGCVSHRLVRRLSVSPGRRTAGGTTSLVSGGPGGSAASLVPTRPATTQPPFSRHGPRRARQRRRAGGGGGGRAGERLKTENDKGDKIARREAGGGEDTGNARKKERLIEGQGSFHSARKRRRA